ncbi:MAG: hypothetical protein ABI045_00160 [Flavobacteriales bacterium]
MVPSTYIFEEHTNNYPFKNILSIENFKGYRLVVYECIMVTVLNISFQNKDFLKHFKKPTWKAIELEMERIYYQKAIQAAAAIPRSTSQTK